MQRNEQLWSTTRPGIAAQYAERFWLCYFFLARWSRKPKTSLLFGTPVPTPDVAGYMVYYGTDGTNFDNGLDAGTNTTVTVANLQPGTTNYFEVVAYDTNNLTSPPSNLLQYDVPVVTQTLTLVASPANGGNVTGGGTFAEGSSVTATATAAAVTHSSVGPRTKLCKALPPISASLWRQMSL